MGAATRRDDAALTGRGQRRSPICARPGRWAKSYLDTTLSREANAVIGENEYQLEAEDVTWVPSGVPHCFINRGQGQMRIYWVYGGRDVTRTIVATGETFEHLSEQDRGATKAT